MYHQLFAARPHSSYADEAPDVLNELDEEDGYDRFSKKTSYESKADYNAYAGVEKDYDDSDAEDYYDTLDGIDHSME